MTSWFKSSQQGTSPSSQSATVQQQQQKEIAALRSIFFATHQARTVAGAAGALKQRGASIPSMPVSELLHLLYTLHEFCKQRNQIPPELPGVLQCLSNAVNQRGNQVPVSSLPSEQAAAAASCALSLSGHVLELSYSRLAQLDAELRAALSSSSARGVAAAEMMKLGQLASSKHTPVLSVPHGRFPLQGPERQLLASILTSKSNLSVIDLSFCFLGDPFVLEVVLPNIAALPHLQLLSLRGNSLTKAFGEAFVQFLSNISNCRTLAALNLSDNDIAPGDRQTAMQLVDVRSGGGTGSSAILPSSSNTTTSSSSSKLRVLSLDGCGPMRAITQLQCLATSERLMPRVQQSNTGGESATAEYSHIGEAFDHIFAVSSGAVVACALALRLPLAKVVRFFDRLASNVFAESPNGAIGYAQLGLRAVRDWWTGGNFYSDAAVLVELTTLFGDAVFDFPQTQVTVVAADPSSGPVLLSSCPLLAPALHPLEISRTNSRTTTQRISSPPLLVRDVCMAAMSTHTLFAPRPFCAPLPASASSASGGGSPARDAVNNSTSDLCTKPVKDAAQYCPNPIHLAMLEAIALLNERRSEIERGGHRRGGDGATPISPSLELLSLGTSSGIPSVTNAKTEQAAIEALSTVPSSVALLQASIQAEVQAANAKAWFASSSLTEAAMYPLINLLTTQLALIDECSMQSGVSKALKNMASSSGGDPEGISYRRIDPLPSEGPGATTTSSSNEATSSTGSFIGHFNIDEKSVSILDSIREQVDRYCAAKGLVVIPTSTATKTR